jgi:antitoxin PrlF
MATATMTPKGQITIPVETRKKLGLIAGLKVEFIENNRGEVALRPKTVDIRSLRGCIRYDGPTLSLEQIDAAIAKELRTRMPRRRA